MIRGTLLPTPKEQTEPLARQRAHGALVCFARLALLLGIDRRPEGMPERCSGPLHAGVAAAWRAREAPVDAAFLATTFCHRGQAGALLECGGGRRAVAWGAAGNAEPGSEDGASPWKAREQGAVGMAWAQSWRARQVARSGLRRAGPSRPGGVRRPASVGQGMAALMAWRRWVITSAARPWGACKQGSRRERRARGTACRGGQGRRTSPKMRAALSCHHGRAWGKEFCRVLVRRWGLGTGSPTPRRRWSTRCARARRVGRGGVRGGSVSRWVRSHASCRAASVGSSWARLGGNASRYRARGRGWTGKSPKRAYVRKAKPLGPLWRARPRAIGWPSHRVCRAPPRPPWLLAGGQGCRARGARRPPLVSTQHVWPPPSRGRCRPHMLRTLLASGVLSQRLGQWCQGTCERGFCAGMRGSRCSGRPCVCVDAHKRTCGGEDRFGSIRCCGLHIRHLRVPVPALTGSYLPAVLSITESRTVYL